MMSNLTLGSLFDGSGCFPLGAILTGITPIWASEIEPFPIRITTKRLPQVKHYGDISKINGAEIEPVDIITFGSPCTNLSIAGKREGLVGKQSSLFYEAIRIIKEMRCKTNGKYPRYAVWENVPGAFPQIKERTFEPSLNPSQKLKMKPYLFLNMINGQRLEPLWEMITPLHGECLMLNTSEYPSEENVSFLSQILMADVPTKYYLSKKACQGILRRAKTRGKVLPTVLQQALEIQSVSS